MFYEADENAPPSKALSGPTKNAQRKLGERSPLAPHKVHGARWDANRSFEGSRLSVIGQVPGDRKKEKDGRKGQLKDSWAGSAVAAINAEPMNAVQSERALQERGSKFTAPGMPPSKPAPAAKNDTQEKSCDQLPEGVQDIDDPSRDPVSLIPAYAQANTEQMRLQEMTLRPRSDYMDAVQKNIKPRMRTMVIDWIIDVADDTRMVTETLYLTVAYFDRFLSLVPVHQNDLQLVATACMLIASKFEEIHPPPLDKLSEITANHCSPKEIISAEGYILSALDFRIALPTAKVFVQRFLRAVSDATEVEYRYLEQYVRYVLELALRDYGCLQFRPSTLAAGTLLLSRFILAGAVGSSWCGQWVPHRLWNKTTQYYTFHSAAALKQCVRHIHQLLMRDQQAKTSAPYRKYSDRRRKQVSKFQVPALDENIFRHDFSYPVPSTWLHRGYE